jgi:hypothetical protein
LSTFYEGVSARVTQQRSPIMMSPTMRVTYVSHREISIEGYTIYLVKLSISGPVFLITAIIRT